MILSENRFTLFGIMRYVRRARSVRSRRARGAVPAASGPRPSRQRVRSPALPACSSAAAAVPTPAGANRLGRAFELVRGGRQRGQVAGARRGRDLALGRDRGIAELRQQRVDRGGIVAEPGGEHLAIDRGGRLRGVVGVGRSRASRPRSASSVRASCAAGPCSPAWRDRRPCRRRGSARPHPSWRSP